MVVTSAGARPMLARRSRMAMNLGDSFWAFSGGCGCAVWSVAIEVMGASLPEHFSEPPVVRLAGTSYIVRTTQRAAGTRPGADGFGSAGFTLLATGRRALCRCTSHGQYCTAHGACAPSQRWASPPLRKRPRGCRQAGMVGLMSLSPTTRRFAKGRRFSALAGGLLVCALACAPSASASAASTPTVNLGQAASYAVMSGASVTNANTGTTGPTTVHGDLGAPAQPTGFPPGVVTGTIQVGSADATAYSDFVTAYTEVQNRPPGTTLPAMAGATLTPGLYTSGAAAGLAASTTVTLDAGGDPNAVFVFQVNGALSLGAGAQVKLTGGAQASHVFWAVYGGFALGAGGKFAGTAMASTTGGIGVDSVVNGRVFAQAAVTMDTDQFYSAPPTVTLTGGAAEDINNSTPTISGSTNVGASGVVTVTVAGQTLTATPADDGSWSVTPKILANATYTVLASTTDGAGNVGTATQQLTIDTVPPLITLTGPVLTNNPTATISGTTDAAAGTIIDVDVEAQTLTAVVNGTTIVESVGAQTLTALVQSTGTWNITPAPMGEGTRTVTAAVTDLAGNTSTATEQLTVDTVPPLITLTGPVLTNNPTPTISGTTDAPSGAVVTVNLADETRPGSVRRNVV